MAEEEKEVLIDPARLGLDEGEVESEGGDPEGEASPTSEELASKDGWVPEDEWEGEPEKWVPADEFMRRKPLFERISTQSKQIKKINEALKAMQSHHAKVFEASYQKAIDDLKSQRDQAVEEGDSRAVRAIEENIESINEEYIEESKTVKAAEAGPSVLFEDWVAKNEWYSRDRGMKTRADEVGIGYARSNPEATEEEIFDYVDDRIRREYPDKFGKAPGKARKPVAQAVESGEYSKKTGTKKQVQLTEVEKRVMDTLVRTKQMTKEEYLAEIAKIR